MNRLEKKCLVASMSLHALLLCVALFGSAFFIASEKAPPEYTRMRVVPTRLVDAAFSGGGGNPNLKPSDAQQKGNPDPTPKPQPPPQVPKPVPQPPPPQPTPQPKEPTPPPKAPTPKKVPVPVKDTKKPEPKPNDRYEDILSALKPAKSNDRKKASQKAEEDSARKWNAENQKIAKQISRTVDGLAQGFEQGTVVQAYGPGGEAYANYADFVRQKYEDAWVVSDMMSDAESTVRVSVTIHRSGRVMNARIGGRSGNSALDSTVQRALDKVRFIAPFPEGSRDEQRTFNINFNLKTKRLLG